MRRSRASISASMAARISGSRSGGKRGVGRPGASIMCPVKTPTAGGCSASSAASGTLAPWRASSRSWSREEEIACQSSAACAAASR